MRGGRRSLCVEGAERLFGVGGAPPFLTRTGTGTEGHPSYDGAPRFCRSKSLPMYCVFLGWSSGRWRSQVPNEKLAAAAMVGTVSMIGWLREQ